VEYVLGAWFLATRFQQAAQRAEPHLPKGCRMIAGTIDINADFVCVSGPDAALTPSEESVGAKPQPSLATLTVKPWVPRPDPTEAAVAPALTLRERIRADEAEPAQAPKGFLARLFGRFSRH
jgi:hypothetical protein